MKRKWLSMKLMPPAANHPCPRGMSSTSPSQLVSSASSSTTDSLSLESA